MYEDDDIMDFDDNSSYERKRSSKKRSSKKPKKNPLLPVTIVMALITLASLSLCILMALGEMKEKEKQAQAEKEQVSSNTVTIDLAELEDIKSQAYNQGQNDKQIEIYDRIKNHMSQPGAGSMELFWEMFDGYVIYNTSNGYAFDPINPDIPANDVNKDNIVVCDSGEIKYCENGETVSHMGIDVSSYQGDIDWEQVAAFGVEYAYIRAGYRGYGSGKLVADEKADANISGALENGINTGVYFFTQAVTEEEIDEEIQMMVEAVAPYPNFNGPFIIDVEKVDDSTARGNQLTKEERTQLVLHFCNKVRELGYEPMIYGNLNSIFNMLDSNQVANETIWFALYSNKLYYPYKLHGWQYSCSFSVPGIEGNVDASIIF